VKAGIPWANSEIVKILADNQMPDPDYVSLRTYTAEELLRVAPALACTKLAQRELMQSPGDYADTTIKHAVVCCMIRMGVKGSSKTLIQAVYVSLTLFVCLWHLSLAFYPGLNT
jgi:hypothetical protein